MNNSPLWFSLFTNNEYVSEEKAFVDTSKVEGIKNLESSYLTVLTEMEEYLQKHQMQSHFNVTMVEKPQSWKVRSLRVWGVEMYDVQKHFQRTMTLINAIPGVINVGFNILEPNAKIKPHGGDTNAIIRNHLGLKIPASSPTCALKVKGETMAWENGKVLSFIDAFQHEAWNSSNEIRIILLFDILKPEYLKKKNGICAIILSSLYVQRIGNIWPGLYKQNRKLFRYILMPLIVFLKCAIPIRNKLKK